MKQKIENLKKEIENLRLKLERIDNRRAFLYDADKLEREVKGTLKEKEENLSAFEEAQAEQDKKVEEFIKDMKENIEMWERKKNFDMVIENKAILDTFERIFSNQSSVKADKGIANSDTHEDTQNQKSIFETNLYPAKDVSTQNQICANCGFYKSLHPTYKCKKFKPQNQEEQEK